MLGMKAQTALRFAIVLLVGGMLCVPGVCQARRVYVVRDKTGRVVRVVDPEKTTWYRVTHPWKLLSTPYNFVRSNVVPSKTPQQGFDQPMTQKQMETAPTVTETVSEKITGAASKVNSVPVVNKCTGSVSRFFNRRSKSAATKRSAAN